MNRLQTYARGARMPLAAAVRENDRDRYLTVLFAPAAARPALFALYAFNHEVAKTRETVSEAMLGHIRLEWWRESIAAIYDGQPLRRHEVVEALGDSVRRHGLGRAHLEALIDARERDLDDEPPTDLAALEDYARATSLPLVLLALEALGVPDAAAARAAESVGLAYALAGLLRATPFQARLRRSHFPADLVAARGLALHRSLFELKWEPGLGEIAAAIAARARLHLAAARALRDDVPAAALPALLPAVLADRSLGAIARVGYDLLSPRLSRPDGGKPLALALAALRRRY